MKKHKTLIIVFGIIIFLAILGFAYWLIMGSKSSSSSSTGNGSSASNPTSSGSGAETTNTSTTYDNSACISKVKALCVGTDNPQACEAAAIPKLCPQ